MTDAPPPSSDTKKRSRRLYSCDSCHRKKRKCEPISEASPPFSTCAPCQRLGLECTFAKALDARSKRRKDNGEVDSPSMANSLQERQVRQPVASTSALPDSPIKPASASLTHHDGSNSNTTIFNKFQLPPSPLIREITDLAPLQKIGEIIDLFFKHLHPLNPIIDRKSFEFRFLNGEYRQDPAFFALLCSLIALSLVQIPSIFTAHLYPTAQLSLQAISLSRDVCLKTMVDPPSLDYVRCKYLETLYHLTVGNIMAVNICLSESFALCANLELDKPATYNTMSVMEGQLARRILWILFTADKMNALFGNRAVRFNLEFGHIDLPAEVDDDQLALSGNLQADRPSPTMTAFCLNSRIGMVLASLLPIIRQDRARSPEGTHMFERLTTLQELEDRLIDILKNCSTQFKLPRTSACDELMDRRFGTVSPGHLQSTTLAESEFQALLQDILQRSNATGSDLEERLQEEHLHRAHVLHILQANVQVSFLATCIEINRHRRNLFLSMNMPMPQIEERLLRIAHALLNVVMSIPISAIAANGRSITRKIRHVIDLLQEMIVAPQAQKLLGEYLTVLMKIEGEYGFGNVSKTAWPSATAF